MLSGGQGQEQGDLSMPPSKVGREDGCEKILGTPKEVTSRGAPGGRDKQEVPCKEVRTQPLEYLVGTMGNPTTQKRIVGERLESVYSVEERSTRSPIIHRGVIPSQLTTQTVNTNQPSSIEKHKVGPTSTVARGLKT